MTNNEIKISDLQDAINAALAKFDGASYEGTEYHSWYHREITTTLLNNGVYGELKATTWEIVFDAEEKGVWVSMDTVAKVKCDLKRDKRFKWGAGRGKCNSIRVEFEPDYLNMTYGEMRKAVFNKEKEKRIAFCKEQYEEFTTKAREALEKQRQLEAVTF